MQPIRLLFHLQEKTNFTNTKLHTIHITEYAKAMQGLMEDDDRNYTQIPQIKKRAYRGKQITADFQNARSCEREREGDHYRGKQEEVEREIIIIIIHGLLAFQLAWTLCQRPRDIFLCVLITPGPLPRSYRNSTRLKGRKGMKMKLFPPQREESRKYQENTNICRRNSTVQY